VDLLHLLGLVPLPGTLDLDLYPFYAVAAVCGWLAGNLWVARAAGLPRGLRWRLLLVYLVGPPGVLFLLRAMAPAAAQMAAPFVALYAFGVFAVFFAVPVTLRRSTPPRERPRFPPRGGSRD
jgi:hypothetical protein